MVLAVHAAVVPPGDGPHQRQPQAHAARAFAGAGQAVEGLKDAFALVQRHARTAVAHAHFGQGAAAQHLHGDFARAVAAGVFQQVANGAAQQFGDAAHFQPFWHGAHVQVRVHAGAFFGGQADQIHVFHGAHIGLAGVQAAGQQDFIHQLVQLGNVAQDFSAEGGRGRLPPHQLQPHADAGERRAQFVRGIGQQGLV